jgi:hypothetical protein
MNKDSVTTISNIVLKQFALIVAFVILIASCKKSNASNQRGNQPPENYFILDGIQHAPNHWYFQVRSDSSFYFQMDTVNSIYYPYLGFIYSSIKKLSLGQFGATDSLNGVTYTLINFTDNLLFDSWGPVIELNQIGSLTITDISNGEVSGYFTGQFQYRYNPRGSNDSTYTLSYSGVFKNDSLAKQ